MRGQSKKLPDAGSGQLAHASLRRLTMKHVYFIRSLSVPNQRYIGVTSSLDDRLRAHNTGASPHTSKYPPWELVTFVSFRDDQRAFDIERYLKTGSGRAFANKHLW